MDEPNPTSVKLIPPDYRRWAGLVLLGLAAAGLLVALTLAWRYHTLDNWVDRYQFINNISDICDLGLIVGLLASFFSSLLLQKNRWGLTAAIFFFLLLGIGLSVLAPIFFIFSISLAIFLLGLRFIRSSVIYGLAAVFFSFLFTCMFSPSIDSQNIRSAVSHTRSDLRSLAIALDCYYLDHHAFPVWTNEPAEKILWHSTANMPTFRHYTPGGTTTLTIPTAYITTLPDDRFVRINETRTFAYWVSPDNAHWILWSPGPDMRFDLDRPLLERTFNPDPQAWWNALIPHAYDSSNGTVSAGDVWRIKE